MQAIVRSGLAAIAALALSVSAAMADCQNGLGVARIVEIDTTGGPVFGMITKRTREDRFLGPKEVVLTFDDGPMPGVTRPILDTLDRYCTKATFFSVGKMAITYPEQIREILKRGHTVGTHTWSHPMSLPRLKGAQARDQIESGFAAVAMAAGQPIAPFFRFPGLNDSPALIEHLESRNIATFSVDVVSNDSYISDPGRLIERTLQQLDAEKGGIMLFHDIKPQTARALPAILAEIKARGFRVVHLRAKAPFVPDMAYVEAVRAHVAVKNPSAMRQLAAFTDSSAPAAPVPESPVVASSPAVATPAAAPEMAAALVEAEPPRAAAKPRAAQAGSAQGALAETSSWTAVLTEPKAAQPSRLQPGETAANKASPAIPAPADALAAPPRAVAQASDERPEVRRNGRVIRVLQPKQPTADTMGAKPATLPAALAPVEPIAAPAPDSKGVASTVPAAVKAVTPQPAPEQKPVVATQPTTPQRPRIINAPDATEPAATAAAGAATAAAAAPIAKPVEKPAGVQAEPAAKTGVAGMSSAKPAAVTKPETATAAAPASRVSPALPPDAAGAVAVPLAAAATPVAPPTSGGSGIEVLAGTYNASAAASLPANAASSTTAASPPAAAEAPATAGRFAAPEIIAGSYRQQTAVPASEARRSESPKQKRTP